MDKPISVGDLVQVVKETPCCRCGDSLGKTFVVEEISNLIPTLCKFCGSDRDGLAARISGAIEWCDLYRLKRFPPLSELEGAKTEEKLREKETHR